MTYPKDKDYTQVIKSAYDDETGRLKVESLISDGIDALIINPDGSINVNVVTSGPTVPPTHSVEAGIVDTIYNEITSVASGILTQIVTYSCVQPTRVKFSEVTGTNIAEYTVLVNNLIINKKRTFWGSLDSDFQFSKGLSLNLGDIVSVNVIHNQSTVGAFSAFILVLKDNTVQ